MYLLTSFFFLFFGELPTYIHWPFIFWGNAFVLIYFNLFPYNVYILDIRTLSGKLTAKIVYPVNFMPSAFKCIGFFKNQSFIFFFGGNWG